MNELGMKIKKLREEADKTPQQYAEMMGVSRQAVLKWESGATSNLKLENLKRISEYHKISVDELIGGRKKSQPLNQNRTPYKNTNDWPFSVHRERYDALPKKKRDQMDDFIRMMVNDWESQGKATKRSENKLY